MKVNTPKARHSRRSGARKGAHSGVDQHAWIEHALRVELALGGPQRTGEQLRALAVVPGPMVAAYGMMMGDGAAGRDQGVARRSLDRLPLLEQRTVAAEPVEGEVGRGAIGIDMGEAAGDLALFAGRFHDGAFGRRLHLVMEVLEPVPGDRRLESVVDDAGGSEELPRI